MNSTKISQLPLATELKDDDLLLIVSGNSNKKISVNTLMDKMKQRYVGKSVNISPTFDSEVNVYKYPFVSDIIGDTWTSYGSTLALDLDEEIEKRGGKQC